MINSDTTRQRAETYKQLFPESEQAIGVKTKESMKSIKNLGKSEIINLKEKNKVEKAKKQKAPSIVISEELSEDVDTDEGEMEIEE